MYFIIVINIFILSWLIRAFKSALFWIYLWQLKAYHIGRFIDHFRTFKGKKIFLNFFLVSKFVFLYLILLSNGYFLYYAFSFLLIIYVIEFIIFIKNILLKDLKIPHFTSKTVFLTSVSFILIISYLFLSAEYLKTAHWQTFFAYLLIFDIFIPVIISAIVLIFQPFFVLARNNVLKKAKEKIIKFNNLTVIAITGSYGKTSTKEFLTTILAEKFKVLATHEHQNSEIGIAQCILNDLTERHQIFIVEMGAYNKGGIDLLCKMVKPKMGIVTGVNEQHLSTFGSLNNLLSAEGGRELSANLPKDGLLVVNGDNKYCIDLYKKADIFRGSSEQVKKRIYTVNRDKINSDIWTEDLTVREDSLSFVAVSKDREMAHFDLKVLGRQNIQNLLGAILIAKEIGMNMEEISLASKQIKQEQAGIILKRGIYSINIIDSSYSSNPNGVMADLDYLNVFGNKKIIIMPCLIELGNRSAEIHKQIGKKIAEICDLAIITTRDKFEDLKTGAVENGMSVSSIVFLENSKDIFTEITTYCTKGDAVLLEGRVPGGLIKLLSRPTD